LVAKTTNLDPRNKFRKLGFWNESTENIKISTRINSKDLKEVWGGTGQKWKIFKEKSGVSE